MFQRNKRHQINQEGGDFCYPKEDRRFPELHDGNMQRGLTFSNPYKTNASEMGARKKTPFSLYSSGSGSQYQSSQRISSPYSTSYYPPNQAQRSRISSPYYQSNQGIRNRDAPLNGGEDIPIQDTPEEQPFIEEKIIEHENKFNEEPLPQYPTKPPFYPPSPPPPPNIPPPPPPPTYKPQSHHTLPPAPPKINQIPTPQNHAPPPPPPKTFNQDLGIAYKWYHNDNIDKNDFDTALHTILTNRDIKNRGITQQRLDQIIQLILERCGEEKRYYINIVRKQHQGRQCTEKEIQDLNEMCRRTGINLWDERGLGDWISSGFKKVGEFFFGKPKPKTTPTATPTPQSTPNKAPDVPITKNNQGQWDLKAIMKKQNYYNEYMDKPEAGMYQLTQEELDALDFARRRNLLPGPNNKSGLLDVNQQYCQPNQNPYQYHY
ncbi:MAG: hypothetical protein LBR15_09045 [Methanobrevibacter sp.]|jgi:hypothetical protein|nr:hypothetical protein [Candidatus Methanovirga australis]